ncbi:MAG: YbbR-like domain-containing protein [Eubacteriales bacterium]
MQNNQDVYDNTQNEKVRIPKRWFFSRIICFLVALGIWIYVVNVTTQDTEKTFNLIDINVEGMEELQEATNMSLVNLEESKVSVTVKGLRSDIAKLSEKDFSAYIDISKITEVGKHDLSVSVNLPSTVSLVSRYPESVTVSVDETIERIMPIEVDITEYSIENIYEMGIPTVDVQNVTVTGPSDILNRIKSAKAYINLGTVLTSTVVRTEIVLVDKTGNPIDTALLSMDNKTVKVTVPVTMEKTVPLVCGFSVDIDPSEYSIRILPGAITIKGDPKVLNSINAITAYTFAAPDVTDMELNFSEIELPGGIEVVNAPETVKITAVRVVETTERAAEADATAQEDITTTTTGRIGA